mgnify:CR=1 FL=1
MASLGDRIMSKDDEGILDDFEYLENRSGPELAVWKKDRNEYIRIKRLPMQFNEEVKIEIILNGGTENLIGPVEMENVIEQLEKEI